MTNYAENIRRARAEVKDAIEHGDRKGRWYAEGKLDAFLAMSVAAQGSAQSSEPAIAEGERAARTALLPDDDHAGILIRAAEDAEVAAALHRTAIADGLTDDAGAAEWAEKQARTFRAAAAALAQSSTPPASKGEAK